MSSTVQHNAGVKALIRVVEEVQKHYPRMELGQLAVLLRVLEKPGVTAADIARMTGLSKSAMSRAVRVLGSAPYTHDGDGTKRETGLNLITQVQDLTDTRSKIIAPTRLGRRLGEQFDTIIGEANGKTKGETVAS